MKKRILTGLLGALAVFGLVSCGDAKNTTTSNPTPTTSVTPTPTSSKEPTPTASSDPTPTSSTGDNPTPTSNTGYGDDPTPTSSLPTSTTTTTISEENKNFRTPEIVGPVDPSNVTLEKKHFDDYMKKNGPFAEDAFPSLGSPKFLVVPVSFDDTKKTSELRSDIVKAFTGTAEDTGWESVKSYYEKSSYGKLTLDAEVTEWFTPSHNASYYETYYDEATDEDGSCLLVKEALNHFDSTYDYSEYDYDEDGFIDSIWLIYNAPVDYEEADFWWAYQTKTGYDDVWDGVKSSRYGFAGTDFMDPTKEELDYNTDSILVDAHTFIHESGHLMGLEDYYDYDTSKGPDNNMYGADMMDANIGDHCSFNKLLLGWVDPTIATGDGLKEVSLHSFTETGEFLLIADHELETIYDEYFLIEFYTNTGLNKNDEPIISDKDEDTGEIINEAMGIRIIHVDARLSLDREGNVVDNGDSSYPGTGFIYDNSGTSKTLIEHLRADFGPNMEEYLWPESLYTSESGVFGVDIWSTFKLNDGTSLIFTLKVKDIADGVCTFEITLK